MLVKSVDYNPLLAIRHFPLFIDQNDDPQNRRQKRRTLDNTDDRCQITVGLDPEP